MGPSLSFPISSIHVPWFLVSFRQSDAHAGVDANTGAFHGVGYREPLRLPFRPLGYGPPLPNPLGGSPFIAPRPPRFRPRPRAPPRPRLPTGNEKSGLALRFKSSWAGALGRPFGGPDPFDPGGGRQFGLTPRWLMEVKWLASEPAGLRWPSAGGMESYEA